MEDKILIHVDEKEQKHDYNHIVALISFTDDDSYNLKSVTTMEHTRLMSN